MGMINFLVGTICRWILAVRYPSSCAARMRRPRAARHPVSAQPPRVGRPAIVTTQLYGRFSPQCGRQGPGRSAVVRCSPGNRRVGLPDIRKYGVPSSPRSRRSSARHRRPQPRREPRALPLGPRLPLALRGPARQQPVETILHAAPDAAWCWCGPADCGAAVSATRPGRPTSGPTCGGRSRVLKNPSSSRPSATSPSSWSSPPTSRGAGRNEINATDLLQQTPRPTPSALHRLGG